MVTALSWRSRSDVWPHQRAWLPWKNDLLEERTVLPLLPPKVRFVVCHRSCGQFRPAEAKMWMNDMVAKGAVNELEAAAVSGL